MISERRAQVIKRLRTTNESIYSLARAIINDIEIIKMYRKIFEYPIDVVMEIQMLIMALNTDSKKIAEIGIRLQEIVDYTLENELFDLAKVTEQLDEIEQRSTEIARIAGCEVMDVRGVLFSQMLLTQKRNL